MARRSTWSWPAAPLQRRPDATVQFQDTYLRTALAFIGLDDIELITVEGGDFGPQAADRAVSNAFAKVSAIAA